MSSTSVSTPVSVPTVTRTEFDEDVAAARDDDVESYDGWYCVSTDPFPCPAAGCDFVAKHMTAAHLIVVWPRLDDSSLLAQASNAKLAGRNPRVVEYERALGPCVPWDVWMGLGRPVHAFASKPDGWDEGRRMRL